ncbi:MAG TPA: FMN-binding protein [Desulfitobacteriaceae bacterium]|nr:FMN-binding protein [Desulfitobacteriaceae bacterium]
MEHKSNDSSIFKVAINLIGACIISGLIIATVFTLTAATAAEKLVEIKNSSLQSMVTEADTIKEIQGKPEWFEAMKNGKLIAYIVPAESKGYAGAVELLVAISPDFKVMKYTITASKETPGLGDKAKDAPFAGQFVGKDAEHLEVTKDPSKTQLIQAISGSTITSRAVTKAVREAVEAVTAFAEGGK